MRGFKVAGLNTLIDFCRRARSHKDRLGSSDSGYGIPRSALMGADRHAVDIEADTGKPFGGVTCATIRRKVNKNRFLVGMAFGIGVWF